MYNIENTYVYFDVLDYNGVTTLSAFTLSNTPLTFIPDFTTSTILSGSRKISNKNIRWDFGDGNFSTDLRPKHNYKWPGEYSVTLTVFDSEGNAYDSTYTATIQVYDFISSQINFRDYRALIYDVPAGRLTEPLYVDVYNSWQNYPALSSTGYTINLYASGARGDYNYTPIDVTDKWDHLRPTSRFYIQNITETKDVEYLEVESVTATQTEIYVKQQNDQIVLCAKNDIGSVFAGTTGTCEFWYTDERPGNLITESNPVILFATIDNSKFKDAYTQRSDTYERRIDFPSGTQNLNPAVFPSLKVRFNSADRLSITTTGIDGEGTLSTTKFDIPRISWQETEIPYVIKFKDKYNFTTKNYPPLSSSYVENAPIRPSVYNDVQTGIITLSGNDYVPLKDVKFYEDFSDQSPQSLGAFYKGYFVSPQSSENCILTAAVTILEPAHYQKDALVGWIGIPQYNSALRLIRQEYYSGKDNAKYVTLADSDSLYETDDNRNIYAMAVSPAGTDKSFDDYRTWIADYVNDKIVKYDLYGNQLPDYYALSAVPTLINNLIVDVDYRSQPSNGADAAAAPNSIIIDGEENVWVTLFDSGTAIKIDTTRGIVTATASPSGMTNFSYTLSSDYLLEDGFAGENIVLPSSIDVDLENNVWIAYSHPNFNYIIKYRGTDNFTTAAETIKEIPFPKGIVPDEICIDRNKNVWVTTTNLNDRGATFDTFNDYVYKFDTDGNLINGFPLSGFKQLGNITVDGNQNAWVAHHRETLTKIDGLTNQQTDYIAGVGKNDTNYICSIGGLTCDTSNYIWVINNFDKRLYILNTELPPLNFLNFVTAADLVYPSQGLPPVSAYSTVTSIPSGFAGSNLVRHSQDFSQSTWTKTNATVSNLIVSPYGTVTGNLLAETTATGFHNVVANINRLPGTVYTFSIHAKNNGRRYFNLIVDDGNSNGFVGNFDLQTGTTSLTANNGTGILYTCNMVDVGNGWYRCSITGEVSNTGTTGRVAVNMNTDGNASWYPTYAGSGSPTGIYIWGAQLENTLNPNFYVPTTTQAISTTVASTALTIPTEGINSYSDGLQEFQAIGDWNGYKWINKYAAPVSTVRTITGASNIFNIYPTTGKYNISKVNENWDASNFYNSLRYQESLLDKEVFFNEFLGTIVGDIDSQPYELGKTVYEKIANFVSNKSDPDKVNVDSLLSFCNELTVDFEEYNYMYPPQLKRLIDMLSIKQSLLWGTPNKYALNFDSRGTTVSNNTYGINLSSKIDIKDGVFYPGVPIVARELFSDLYKVVNTNDIPDSELYEQSITVGGTYTNKPLSAINVGYWNMNEQSGQRNDITNTRPILEQNGTVTSTSGISGLAAYINNAAWLTLPQGVCDVGSSPKTISIWFKLYQTDVGYQWILMQGSNTDYSDCNPFFIEQDGNLVCKFTTNPTPGTWTNILNFTTTPPAADTWHHAVLTFDGRNANAFFNGKYISTTSYIGGIVAKNTNYTLGMYKSGIGNTGDQAPQYSHTPYPIAIGKIGIWNSVLTPEDIGLLYTSSYMVSGIPYYIEFNPDVVTYIPLSSYTPKWGWTLTAPDTISGTDIGTYYSFYNYHPEYNNNYYDNIIDWNSKQTTLTRQNSSYSDWSSDEGIIHNILSYELTKGFRLFTSAVNITYNS